MDLTSGERSQPALFGGRLLFTTIIPTSDGACGNGGTGWLMEVDALSGGKLNGTAFDVNGDGKIDSDDNLGSEGGYGSGQQTASIPSAIRLQKNPGGAGNGTLNKLISQSKVDLSAAVSGSLVNVKNSLPSSQKRTSWRQILE